MIRRTVLTTFLILIQAMASCKEVERFPPASSGKLRAPISLAHAFTRQAGRIIRVTTTITLLENIDQGIFGLRELDHCSIRGGGRVQRVGAKNANDTILLAFEAEQHDNKSCSLALDVSLNSYGIQYANSYEIPVNLARHEELPATNEKRRPIKEF